jgi:hypothetical protein
MHDFIVTVAQEDGGPEPELCERLATVAKYRLEKLAKDGGAYPEVGADFDMLDSFEGPFFWEMSDAQREETPPSSVQFEVLSVDPAEAPADGAEVNITVRVPF